MAGNSDTAGKTTDVNHDPNNTRLDLGTSDKLNFQDLKGIPSQEMESKILCFLLSRNA